MKKKFTGILLSFCLLCMGLLAGCSLVETDYGKYYNQVVAVVENKETGRKAEITKLDLISGYQSYGYTYEQYNGYTPQEAFAMTLELLENRKISLITAEDEYGYDKDGTGLSDIEKTYLWQEVVDSLNENLEGYYDDIVGSEDEEDESDDITFNGYQPNAELDKNNAIKSLVETNAPLKGFHPSVNRDFHNSKDHALIYENFIDYVLSSNDDYKKAFDNYLNDLIASENGQNLSKDAPSVFEREIERLYEVAYENYLLELYSYNNRSSSEVSSITASQIVNLYTNKVRASYAQYQLEEDSNYDSNVQDNLNEMYYFKNDEDSTKFFTVANVLFMFTDEQQEKYDEYTEKLESGEGGYDAIQYNQDIDKLYAELESSPVVRKYNETTGIYEEVKSDLTVQDIYDKMVQDLSSAKNTEDVNIVGDTINNFIYEYGEDTGMFNAESNYVIGIDSEGNAVSSFVESFNDAGIQLYNGGKAEIGDISAKVRSEYGIHVLIYTGACENLFDGITSNFSLNEDAITVLNNTRVNVLVDKTYFDVLYDELYTDNYTNYENANIKLLRENYNITEYSNRYSDLIG